MARRQAPKSDDVKIDETPAAQAEAGSVNWPALVESLVKKMRPDLIGKLGALQEASKKCKSETEVRLLVLQSE